MDRSAVRCASSAWSTSARACASRSTSCCCAGVRARCCAGSSTSRSWPPAACGCRPSPRRRRDSLRAAADRSAGQPGGAAGDRPRRGDRDRRRRADPHPLRRPRDGVARRRPRHRALRSRLAGPRARGLGLAHAARRLSSRSRPRVGARAARRNALPRRRDARRNARRPHRAPAADRAVRRRGRGAGCSIRSTICGSTAAPKPPAFRSPRSIPPGPRCWCPPTSRRRERSTISRRRARSRMVSDEYGTVDADVAIEGGGKSWRIERLLAASDRSRAKVTRDRARSSSTIRRRFDLEAGWTDLRWPLDAAAAAMLLAPSGSLRASGTTASYRIEGGFRAALPAVTLAAHRGRRSRSTRSSRVAGDASGARIERLDGRTLGGRVTGEGALSWSPQVDWRLALRGDDLRPGVVDPRLDGDLDLARLDRGQDDGRRTARLDRAASASPVASTASRCAATGASSCAASRFGIPDLRLVWGDAALAAAGVVGDALDLRFRLDAPDLASSCRTSPARSRSTARSSGPRASPGLRSEGRGGVARDRRAAREVDRRHGDGRRRRARSARRRADRVRSRPTASATSRSRV